jgi:predicted nicotinamide N-methyase
VAVDAVDIDPFAEAAIWLNARANAVRLAIGGSDLSADPPPDVDVILAGDVCYAEGMAGRLIPWLRSAANQGIRVLIGDPGRPYLPVGLDRVATYRVRTSRELEPSEVTAAAVYAVPPSDGTMVASPKVVNTSGAV